MDKKSRCRICNVEMDDPRDRSTDNCGGDCLLCMVESGDADLMYTLAKAARDMRQQLAECRRERDALRIKLDCKTSELTEQKELYRLRGIETDRLESILAAIKEDQNETE